LMLRYSLKLEAEAAFLEKAVESALKSQQLTADLGGKLTTAQFRAVLEEDAWDL